MADPKKAPAQGQIVIVDDVRDLNIDDCLKIRALPGTKPYLNTTAGSRYVGKSYRTYLYKGKGFTVIEDDAFCTDLANDNLESVSLRETDSGYEFLGHVSISRADKAHFTKVKRSAFNAEFLQTQRTINPEDWA